LVGDRGKVRRSMAIDLVLDQWPVVLTHFHGETSMADLEAYIRKMTAVHQRRQPYVGISYLQHYSRERAQLERIAQWIKDTEQATRDYCVATALINNSVGFRFVLSTIFLIKAMPCPYQVCGHFDDALAFTRRHAAERALVLPAHVVNPWPQAT